MGLHYSKNIVNFESFLLRFSSISEKWNRESSEENPFLLTSDELWLDYSTQIDADCSFLHHMFLSILVIRNWNRQLTLNLSLLPNLETNQFLADIDIRHKYIGPDHSNVNKKKKISFPYFLLNSHWKIMPSICYQLTYFTDSLFTEHGLFWKKGPSRFSDNFSNQFCVVLPLNAFLTSCFELRSPNSEKKSHNIPLKSLGLWDDLRVGFFFQIRPLVLLLCI